MFLGVHKQISKLTGGDPSLPPQDQELAWPISWKGCCLLKEWADLVIYDKISGLIKKWNFLRTDLPHCISGSHVIESAHNVAE